MSLLIINREDDEISKKQRLKISMALDGGDVEVEVKNVAETTSPYLDVKCAGVQLSIETVDYIKKEKYNKVFNKILGDKRLEAFLKNSAKLFSDVKPETIIRYNESKLVVALSMLNTKLHHIESVFPMDVGATNLSESITNMQEYLRIPSGTTSAKDVPKVTAVYAGLGAGAGAVEGVALSAGTAATVAGAAALSVSFAGLGLAVAGLSFALNLACTKTTKYFLGVATQFLSTGNIKEYCEKMHLTPENVWTELNRVAILSESKNLMELEKNIVDFM